MIYFLSWKVKRPTVAIDDFQGVCFVSSILLLFVDVVVQKLDDQVHVSQDHASAAVSLATQLVQGLPTQFDTVSDMLNYLYHPRRAEGRVQSCCYERLSLWLLIFFTYEVDTFSLSIKSKYLFHLFPTTFKHHKNIVQIITLYSVLFNFKKSSRFFSYLAACEAPDWNDHSQTIFLLSLI